jgi:hypothetical protein
MVEDTAVKGNNQAKPKKLCECGKCGIEIEAFDSRGRERRYIEGHHRGHFKGGRQKNYSGYVYVLSLTHPYRDHHNYVFEHRLVMEQYLGRYLLPEEVVHHINGIIDDNRIENLEVLTRTEHNRIHDKLTKSWRLKRKR